MRRVIDQVRPDRGISFVQAVIRSCGGAAASTLPPEKDVITVENKVSFLRPAVGDIVKCRAEVLRAGKNLIFVEATVTTLRDNAPLLVAKASSTLLVIPRAPAASAMPPK